MTKDAWLTYRQRLQIMKDTLAIGENYTSIFPQEVLYKSLQTRFQSIPVDSLPDELRRLVDKVRDFTVYKVGRSGLNSQVFAISRNPEEGLPAEKGELLGHGCPTGSGLGILSRGLLLPAEVSMFFLNLSSPRRG